ncbi:MAG: hypothetical protein AAF065_14655 [Verrucomicrobiota bacterium]
MKYIIFLTALALLSGCNTTRPWFFGKDAAQIRPEQGYIVGTITQTDPEIANGHTTINIQKSDSHNSLSDLVNRFQKIELNYSSYLDRNDTDFSNKKGRCFLKELGEGTYYVTQWNVQSNDMSSFWPVDVIAYPIKIKAGEIYYIGNFDVTVTPGVPDSFGFPRITRAWLEVKDEYNNDIDDILRVFPFIKGQEIENYSIKMDEWIRSDRVRTGTIKPVPFPEEK